MKHHKIRLSTPVAPKDAAASRRAAIARWHASEQQPEQHALRLDLPAGVYRCDVCGTVGEPVRLSGDAAQASRRWCVVESCRADLGRHGALQPRHVPDAPREDVPPADALDDAGEAQLVLCLPPRR